MSRPVLARFAVPMAWSRGSDRWLDLTASAIASCTPGPRTTRPSAQGQSQQPRLNFHKTRLRHPVLQPQCCPGVFRRLYAVHITLRPHLECVVLSVTSAPLDLYGFRGALTGGKRSVIRLRVEIYLDHLTPAPRSKNSQYVAHVVHPPIRMDASRHHPAVHKIEIVRRERRPDLVLATPLGRYAAGLAYGLLRSST